MPSRLPRSRRLSRRKTAMPETTKTPAKPAKAPKVAKPAPVEAEPTGRVLESYQIILRPLVTEKGMHRSTRNNQYAFEINTQATKADVRRAVEDLFNVKVEKVCTQTRQGKH